MLGIVANSVQTVTRRTRSETSGVARAGGHGRLSRAGRGTTRRLGRWTWRASRSKCRHGDPTSVVGGACCSSTARRCSPRACGSPSRRRAISRWSRRSTPFAVPGPSWPRSAPMSWCWNRGCPTGQRSPRSPTCAGPAPRARSCCSPRARTPPWRRRQWAPAAPGSCREPGRSTSLSPRFAGSRPARSM